MSDLYRDALAVVTGYQGSPPVRDQFLELLADSTDAVWARHPGAHITASALVVNSDLERVLLCLHGRANLWMQLGGHCEPGDSTLMAAALREAEEESGLAGLRADPVPIDLDVHAVNCRHGASQHFDIRFALLAPEGAMEHVSAESHALGWFTADSLPEPLAVATDRLVPLALNAFRKHY